MFRNIATIGILAHQDSYFTTAFEKEPRHIRTDETGRTGDEGRSPIRSSQRIHWRVLLNIGSGLPR